MGAGKVILLDILMIAAILLTFAYFHHVRPAMQARAAVQNTPVQPTAAPTPEVTPQPVIDTRTEWQKKFADHFTDEIVQTDHSYSSPEVSVDIQKYVIGEGSSQVTYFVADIYIARVENFATYMANNRYEYYGTQDAVDMDIDSGAVVSINGDFINYQQSGFMMRNGEMILDQQTGKDICVLYRDGTMETYAGGKYDKQAVMDRDPYHIWNFGPLLLTEEGEVGSVKNISETVTYINPRSAVGYYEPGHYCFVIVEGRQDEYSAGMRLGELGQLFKDLGCKAAYNLDGGGSAMMTFNDDVYTHPSNGGKRKLGDLLLIREYTPAGEQEAIQ